MKSTEQVYDYDFDAMTTEELQEAIKLLTLELRDALDEIDDLNARLEWSDDERRILEDRLDAEDGVSEE